MYETILGRIDALSAALGMIRESQRVLPGHNPWGYSGGVQKQTSEKAEKAKELHKKEADSEVESVESTFTMVEKTEVEGL
jgi:hypothetical protein